MSPQHRSLSPLLFSAMLGGMLDSLPVPREFRHEFEPLPEPPKPDHQIEIEERRRNRERSEAAELKRQRRAQKPGASKYAKTNASA